MKVILSALCALISVLCVSAFPTPGHSVPPQCGDPTFACQDLQSARLCGVVKTCIHDIWATMTVPNDNDEVCDICKEMVKEARDQLLSNMTQEEIKEVFEGSCKLLPVKIIAEGCIKIVDEIIPELVEMLASRMDPTMVCTVSGMCFATKNGASAENHLFNFFKDLLVRHKDSQCSECTTMLTDVQAFLKDTPQNDVKKYLEEFCHEKMPSYLCNIVIKSYFSEIYTFLTSETPAKLCSSVGICPKQCELHEGEPKVKDELTCEFCYHLVEHVKDLITANTTVEEFKTALLNFCNVTGSFKSKCTALVNNYYDMLFSYIKQLDSKGMCTLMGLCNNDTMCARIPLVKVVPAFEVRRKVPLIKLQPAERVQNIERIPLVRLIPANLPSKKELTESNNIFQSQLPIERITHPLSVFQKDTDCAMCKAFTFYLEQDLAGDTSKAGVRHAISGVCEKWMRDYPEQCGRIVSRYSMKIQVALAKGTSFQDLCPLLKTCPLEEETSGGLKVKVIPSLKDGPFCDLCKNAMNEVEKQLSDPATKQKLEDLFGQVCNYLPKSLRSDCTSFINSNIDAVIDILEQELKPDTICPAIGLCSASSMVAVPARVKDLECDVCKDVVTSFRQKLQDPSSKEIVQTFLEEGCIRLPTSLATECKNFVDENIEMIMNIIIQETDPQTVCSLLNICPASLKKPEPVNDLECDLCKQVVEQVKKMVQDPKAEDQIKAALDSVCSYLPSSFATNCEGFVNKYTDLLITLMAQELDPGMVCAALNVCPKIAKKVVTPKVKDVECDLCKEVVGKVEDMIKDKKTEDEIKDALDKVCGYLPSSIATKCENFVNQYTDLLIQLLAQELDPGMVCAALNVCPAFSKKVEAPKVKDVECDLCKEVVGKVEDMIKDEKTEEEIKKALDSVCAYLPSSFATKCENFVNQYTDMLIMLLTQELDPAMICASLKVCPAQDVECQSCQYALHFVQEQLMNPNTQGEVKNLLKKVCDILPAAYSQNCEAFVDEYGASLLTLIAQEIDPSILCFEMQMCRNKTSILKTSSQEVPLGSFKVDECSVCTTVVDYLDKLLELDDVDHEITQLVTKVCGVVPASFKGKCSTMLETYGPYLLQMIGQLADSKKVCQGIDMCPRNPQHVHLIGGSKCTFGPSYWCQSNAHAAACKAEMFCATYVKN